MTTQNVRGFLTPLLVNERRLGALGIRMRIYNHPRPGLADCDVLIVNAKYYGKRWNDDGDGIVDELRGYRERAGALIYCDNYDSTAPIRTEVLPHVTFYLKNMLLKDRSLYGESFYGGRIFTNYFHREFGIVDSEPLYSDPVSDPSLIAKLRLSWNYGLAHYGLIGSRVAALYGRVPIKALLRLPVSFVAPSPDRQNDLSCRVTADYARETVAFHRRKMREKIAHRVPAGTVSRFQFLRELRRSKIVVSPFGWGEFSLRDFETFAAGALLLKPDMSHLETYPDFYRAGETIVYHRWDMSDLEDVVEDILCHYSRYIEVAQMGQERYRYALSSPSAGEQFSVRFRGILDDALQTGATASAASSALLDNAVDAGRAAQRPL